MTRVIVACYPHHVTQRGNRRLKTFFGDDDQAAYLELMTGWCSQRAVAIWRSFLAEPDPEDLAAPLRTYENTGRPLAPRRAGRKPRAQEQVCCPQSKRDQCSAAPICHPMVGG